MKQTWEKAEQSIMEFKQELEELHELLPKSVKIHQKTATLNKAWKKVQVSLNEMDKFITPVKSVDVKSKLLNNEKFRESWVFWKEYLNEQHGIFMRSRAELMALNRLLDISGDNPEKAIYYLEYAVSRLEKNFYKVVEQEEPKHTDKNNSKPIVIKLPSKYKKQHADPLEGLAN
jgi:hypothetical protein